MSNNFLGSNWSSNKDNNDEKRENDDHQKGTPTKYGRWESSNNDSGNGYDKAPGYQSSPDRSPPRKNSDNQYYFSKNYQENKDSQTSSSWYGSSDSQSNDENKYSSGKSSGNFYGN